MKKKQVLPQTKEISFKILNEMYPSNNFLHNRVHLNYNSVKEIFKQPGICSLDIIGFTQIISQCILLIFYWSKLASYWQKITWNFFWITCNWWMQRSTCTRRLSLIELKNSEFLSWRPDLISDELREQLTDSSCGDFSTEKTVQSFCSLWFFKLGISWFK